MSRKLNLRYINDAAVFSGLCIVRMRTAPRCLILSIANFHRLGTDVLEARSPHSLHYPCRNGGWPR